MTRRKVAASVKKIVILTNLKETIMGVLIRGLILLVACTIWAAAAQAGYRLQPGDKLDVTVWQEPKLNRQLTIAPDGGISFPLAGHLLAGGKTVEVIEQQLADKLKLQYPSGVDVSIALAAIKERPIRPDRPVEKAPDPLFFVTGEVAKPGPYSFNRSTSVLQAIASAGGLGPFAAGKRIQIRRKVGNEEHLYDFDYDSFVAGIDTSGNIRLHHGDVIIVPEKKLFE